MYQILQLLHANNMSTATTILLLFFAVIGLGSFAYKIYLQLIIKDPDKKGSLFRFATQIVIITYFLPMSIKYKSPEETNLRKRANIALAIFYISLGCEFLLSIITA